MTSIRTCRALILALLTGNLQAITDIWRSQYFEIRHPTNMYSNTLQLLSKVFQRTAKFKAVPYDWDPKTLRFSVISRSDWRFYFAILSFSATVLEVMVRLLRFILWLAREPQLKNEKDAIFAKGFEVYLKFIMLIMYKIHLFHPHMMARQFNLFVQFMLRFNGTGTKL